MVGCLLCLLVLLSAWFVVRVRARGIQVAGGDAPPSSRAQWFGVAATLVATFPLLRLAPGLESRPLAYWGDMTSHARVAAEIARTGIPNGWIDTYTGGFPIGHHYPPLGWLVLAGGIRLGISPGTAVTALGLAGAFAFVVALYFALARAGAHPHFAALGAILLCWVSPYNHFIGGYETYFSLGLLSQAVVMPICTWLVVATLYGRQRWEVPLFAWLAMAAHPQVTVAAAVVLCLAAFASGSRDAITRSLWTSAYAGLAGAALYGQGIATLHVPFGWPPDLGWRQFGFRPERLMLWLVDGELLDNHRASVMTGLMLAASVVLIMGVRRPSNRGLLLGLMAAFTLSVSGYWLQSLGRAGAFLLSFLQPLRVVSLLPPLAATVVAFGLQRGAAVLASAVSASGRPRLGRAVPLAVVLLGCGVALVGLPSRMKYVSDHLAFQRDSRKCDGGTPKIQGYDHELVRGWLRSLSTGRLWYEGHHMTRLESCMGWGGVDLASAVPTGTAGAVGAHVGVLSRAAQFLEPTRSGSAARAEALAIGYLLVPGGDEPPPAGWTVRNRSGKVQLLEQRALPVGVGCIRQVWKGSPQAVQARLNKDLAKATEADILLDPHRFTAIDYGSGEVVVAPVTEPDCDDRGATVLEASARGGVVSAQVSSSGPVDVVLRVSAFPTWKVWIDGTAAPTPTLIAPGFISVRMPPGTHHVSAEVSLLPHYGALIALAALVTIALAALRGRVRLMLGWLERAQPGAL